MTRKYLVLETKTIWAMIKIVANVEYDIQDEEIMGLRSLSGNDSQ